MLLLPLLLYPFYPNRLKIVKSIIDDSQKQVRCKQSRQLVEKLCTQFTNMLGYYSMINNKNVVYLSNNVLKPEQSSDYASLFIQVQRESMGLEEDQVIELEPAGAFVWP